MSQELTPLPPSQPMLPPGVVPAAPLAWSDVTRDSAEQLLHVLFKHKRLILGLFVSFSIAAAVAYVLDPPPASAVAKILLKPDRQSLEISNLVPPGRALYSLQAMQSELELIKSRDVLRPVAKQLLGAGSQPVSDDQIDSKVAAMSGHITAVTLPETSVIQVKYNADTGAEAEKVLSRIVAQYLKHHAHAYNGSNEVFRFYEKEKEQTRVELERLEDEQRRWQEANSIISVDEQINALLGMLTSQQKQMKETDATLEVALEQSPLLTRLREDLSTAEIGLKEVNQRYTDTDRHVQEKAEQVALIRSQIASARKALANSFGKQSETLRRQINETRASLETLRSKKVDGERLARAVNLARDAFMLYGKKLEETRIADRLDQQQLSNLAVIEKPHRASSQADQLEHAAILPVGSLVGLALGAVIAFGLELFNRALRTRRDVETHLQLPVLATIPLLRSPTPLLRSSMP